MLIGHLSSNVCGSSLLFKQLVELLGENKQLEIEVINTARPSHLTSNLFVNTAVALKVTWAIVLQLRKVDVVTFHSSRPAMMLFGPVLFALTRLFSKPLIVRLFGGALEQEYERLSSFSKLIFDKTVLAADLILLETKHLVSYFNKHGSGCVRWYSNSRKIVDLPDLHEDTTKSCKRFVFLGRVIEDKGIDVILDSTRHFNEGITVDIFGSLDGKYTKECIRSKSEGLVQYKGVLAHEQVHDALFNYDVLILPTFYQGEGYPGVIVEAYSHGLPVIATQWRAIPEIVDDSCGILIPIHSPEALSDAMNSLNDDMKLYARLQRGAFAKRLMFSDKYWADRFVKWCVELNTDIIPGSAEEGC